MIMPLVGEIVFSFENWGCNVMFPETNGAFVSLFDAARKRQLQQKLLVKQTNAPSRWVAGLVAGTCTKAILY